MPIARPTMLASASGVLNTRSSPYRRCRPCVSLKTPPLPGTIDSASLRLASATSSPNTTMRASRAISSLSVRLIAATIVSGLPCGCAGVSKARDVGSTSGENSQSVAVSFDGFGAANAASAASLTSFSTSAVIAAISASVVKPFLRRNSEKCAIGSRRASASRSAGVLYSFSSSESE